MIAAVLCIALGGVSFEKVEIPDVDMPFYPVTGIAVGSFFHADIDGDGHKDLVCNNRVYLRPGGRFDVEQFIPMPDVPRNSIADVWQDRLYVLSPEEFGVYEYRDNEWRRLMHIEHDWHPDDGFNYEPGEDKPPIVLGPMLHDVDGDGEPEILRIDQTGIGLAAIHDNRLEVSNLELFPRPSIGSAYQSATLWPAKERRLQFPNRRSQCDIAIHDRSVVVVETLEHTSSAMQFKVTRLRITGDHSEGFGLDPETSYTTTQLPRYAMPHALNADDRIDFVGSSFTQPTLKNWRPSLLSFVATDGGKSFEVAASRSFNPRSVVVDLDGDGDQDWIAEESGLVAGGMRETANRALFQKKFWHSIKARLQNDDGSFEPEWREIGRFKIELDEPARNFTFRLEQYFRGELIDCTGDFNGDGWRDALVVRKPELLSLYLGGPRGFEKNPETEFAVPRYMAPAALDIDGDGRCDIAGRSGFYGSPALVYLNRGDH